MFKSLLGREDVSPLTELVAIAIGASEPRINVVFVHGLDGDPLTSWRFDDTPSWHTWISSAIPNATVWSLRYRLRSTNWRGGSMAITDRAINILATLMSDIRNEDPIVFVCHSYGGLLIKQVVLMADDSVPQFRSIAERTKGIVFLSTPHAGSSLANYIEALSTFTRPVSQFRN